MRFVIIGGGAAGYFGAVNLKKRAPQIEVILLEKTQVPLAKVKVSGGGRCNVTHESSSIEEFVQGYPRGLKELRGPLHKFGPCQMALWLKKRGVELHSEADGRMFPCSNRSQTIIDCFIKEAKDVGVDVRFGAEVTQIKKTKDFSIYLGNGTTIEAEKVLVATGSSSKTYGWTTLLGHSLEPQVPSLFALTVENHLLAVCSGVTLPQVKVQIEGICMEGPLLITHLGFSGPAILKLSAFAARKLYEVNYRAKLSITWLPQETLESLEQQFAHIKQRHAAQEIGSNSWFHLPKELWKGILLKAGLCQTKVWAHFSREESKKLVHELMGSDFHVTGKSTHKEEFVTSGGIPRREIDFRTMESKLCKGLYFAGEVIDVDGITGGYNFQNAWTTAWLAAEAMSLSV